MAVLAAAFDNDGSNWQYELLTFGLAGGCFCFWLEGREMRGIVLVCIGSCLAVFGPGFVVNLAAVTGGREASVSPPADAADAARKAVSSASIEGPARGEELALADEPSEEASPEPREFERAERSPSDLPVEAAAPEAAVPHTVVAAETCRKKCRLRSCRRFTSRPRILLYRTCCGRIRRLR